MAKDAKRLPVHFSPPGAHPQPALYFGNLAGDTDGTAAAGAGAGRATFRVTALDLAAARAAVTRGPADATITSRFDCNRDGVVNALDLAVVRRNLGSAITADLRE